MEIMLRDILSEVDKAEALKTTEERQALEEDISFELPEVADPSAPSMKSIGEQVKQEFAIAAEKGVSLDEAKVMRERAEYAEQLKKEDILTQRKSISKALRHGYSRLNRLTTRAVAGLGRMVAEVKGVEGGVLDPAFRWMLSVPEDTGVDMDNLLVAISEEVEKEAREHVLVHPEEAYAIDPDANYIEALWQVVSRPENLVQGLVESSGIILAGTLGTMLGGAPLAIPMMAVPISGEVYSQAREEDTDVLPSFAQAMLVGIGEAAIESWTLGRKIGLFKNFRRIVASGLPKVLWEGTKAFFRGTAEEGSQEFNRNFWRWVFTDREQEWFEGVQQAMALGGPLEAVMSGAFSAAGYTITPSPRGMSQAKLSALRGSVEKSEELTSEQKGEIQKELDTVQGDIDKGVYEEDVMDGEPEAVPEAAPEAVTPTEPAPTAPKAKAAEAPLEAEPKAVSPVEELDRLAARTAAAELEISETKPVTEAVEDELGFVGETPAAKIEARTEQGVETLAGDEALREGVVKAEETGQLAEPSTEELAESNTLLSKQLKKIKRLRAGEVKEKVAKLRKQQVARSMKIKTKAAKEGLPTSTIIRKGKAGYKVTAEETAYAPPQLSDKQWETYSRKAYNIYPSPNLEFEQTGAQDALDKLRHGQMLTDYEIGLLENVVGEDVAVQLQDTMRRLRPKGERTMSLLRDIILAWKMALNFDLQITRNAVNFLPAHPVIFTRGTWRSLRGYFSKGYAAARMEMITSDPLYKDAREHDVAFLEYGRYATSRLRGEMYRGRLPERMSRLWKGRNPLLYYLGMPTRAIGRWQLASERAFTVGANSIFLDLWKKRSRRWSRAFRALEEGGLSEKGRVRLLSKAEKHKSAYADTINTFMKISRAKTSSGKAIQEAANYFLWSPAMTWSRVKRPTRLLFSPGSRLYVAKLIAANLAKIYAIMMFIAFVANRYRDEDDQIEVEFDPTATHWGQFKKEKENTWFDLGGGELQHYRTLAQLVMQQKKTGGGRIREVDTWDVLKRWAESRETALIGVLHEVFTGETIFGQKVWEPPDLDELEAEGTPTAKAYAAMWRKALKKGERGEKAMLAARFIAEHFAPEMLQGFIEASLMDGWPTAVGAGLTEYLALSALTYKKSAWAEMSLLEDELAQIYFKKDWENLSPEDQVKLRKDIPQFDRLELQAHEESKHWGESIGRYPTKQQARIKTRMHEAMPSVIKRSLDRIGLEVSGISTYITVEGHRFYFNEKRLRFYETEAVKNIKIDLHRFFASPPSGWSRLSLQDKQKKVRKVMNKSKEKARDILRERMKEYSI